MSATTPDGQGGEISDYTPLIACRAYRCTSVEILATAKRRRLG